jgi:hypothetical protein
LRRCTRRWTAQRAIATTFGKLYYFQKGLRILRARSFCNR